MLLNMKLISCMVHGVENLYMYIDQVTSRQGSSVPRGNWITSQLRALGGWFPGRRRNNRQHGKSITVDFDIVLCFNE